jgi:hypothetical protein
VTAEIKIDLAVLLGDRLNVFQSARWHL